MSSADLPSLHDIYSAIDEEEKMKETHYILQFVWRDLSSKFDIISPYYTSSQGFDSTFTMTCLQDALLHFEMFSFHVLALIGDGASWNQTRFKCLCGHAGKFGAIEGEWKVSGNLPESLHCIKILRSALIRLIIDQYQ